MDRVPAQRDSAPDAVPLAGYHGSITVSHGSFMAREFSFTFTPPVSKKGHSFPLVLSLTEVQPVGHCLLCKEPAMLLLTQGLIKIRGRLKETGQLVHIRNHIFVLKKNITFCLSFHCPLRSFHIPSKSTTTGKAYVVFKNISKNFN